MEPLVTTVIGLVGGLGLSAAFWYWLTHRVVPNVVFSEHISKVALEDGTAIYRVKFMNRSPRRKIIDLSLRAAVHYPTGGPGLSFVVVPENRMSVWLPLSHQHLFVLGPGSDAVTRLDPTFSDPSIRARHTTKVIDTAVHSPSRPLEALLELTDDAYVQLLILCFDGWSGSRRLYESPKYRLRDVAAGPFGSNSRGVIEAMRVQALPSDLDTDDAAPDD